MSFGLNAAQARAKANADLIVFEEVYAIMKEVINQSATGAYEAYVADGTIMTASTPTTSDSQNYFSAWQGTLQDRALISQMENVMRHFVNLGYKIERVTNTATTTTFKWHIYW